MELKELERLGYPLILKIVAARPDHPIPPSIISEVPSIQTRVVNEDRNGYTLLLRNVSLRGVVSYAIYQGEGISLSSISRRQFLIAPEGERYVRIDQVSREIVIVAALFNDGSHEGEPAAALKLKSDQIGYETQEGRAIPMIDRLIRDPALDDVIRLARIKDGLSKLSSEPDDTAMRIMQSQFPDLPVDLVRKELRDAFYSARVNLWSEVYGYAHSSGEYPPPVHPPPLADFLRQRQ